MNKKKQGNQQAIFQIIQQFMGKENIIAVARPFVDYMGSIEGGLFLSQLLYWSDKGKKPGKWVYKTYKEWHDELRLSEYQVRKAAQKCIKRKFLKTKIMKANGNPTVHYKLNYSKFSDSFLKFFSIDPLKTSETITENTNTEHRNVFDMEELSRAERWDYEDKTSYRAADYAGTSK